MQTLYLLLDLGTISIPLLYSFFENKFHFWQYAKYSFLTIIAVAIPFLAWDAYFTKIGVWGFNDLYHLPLKIVGMPLEEWLFFICIPYACLFTQEGFKYYFPKFKISLKKAKIIGVILLTLITVLLVLNFGKWYTTVNFIWFILLMSYTLSFKVSELQTYFPVFLIILIPFFIVNGILTGTGLETPVVWYNNSENINFRILTIPFEDIFYAFNMLFTVQLIFNKLSKNRRYVSK